MTQAAIIRYETSDAAAAENARLVGEIFAQLDRERPAGLAYTVLRLASGTGFAHLVAYDDGDAVLTELPAFAAFQRDAASRFAAPPDRSAGTLVGSYQALSGQALSGQALSGSGAAAGVAVAFIDAFGKRDLATLRGLLDEDVVFESPRIRLRGADAVAAAIGEFAHAVTGITVIDAVGAEDRAMIIYDMDTGPFGTLRAVDHLVLRDGRIIADTLVFDTRALAG